MDISSLEVSGPTVVRKWRENFIKELMVVFIASGICRSKYEMTRSNGDYGSCSLLYSVSTE